MSVNNKNNVEIERKYVIKMPDLSLIRSQTEHTESEILQIYLPSENGETRRIRRRSYGNKTVCTETKKIRIDEMSATEIEREIPLAEFEKLARERKSGTEPIYKTRHTFIYDGQLFEIDIYPTWQLTAIMETELDSREKQIKIPGFIEIVLEVTGDRTYSNAAMSKKMPKELV